MVADKDRANFCDFFVLSPKPRLKTGNNRNDNSREDFDKLFGNG